MKAIVIGIILLFVSNFASAAMIVITTCDQPVMFIFDYKKKTKFVVADNMSEEDADIIVARLKSKEFALFETSDYVDKAVCGVSI